MLLGNQSIVGLLSCGARASLSIGISVNHDSWIGGTGSLIRIGTVVVDDVACDGELLVRTVAQIRAHGGRVALCVCAVERQDGNSRKRLADRGVELSAPIELDEATLRDLARLPIQAGQPLTPLDGIAASSHPQGDAQGKVQP